jgi:hypothetical protein
VDVTLANLLAGVWRAVFARHVIDPRTGVARPVEQPQPLAERRARRAGPFTAGFGNSKGLIANHAATTAACVQRRLHRHQHQRSRPHRLLALPGLIPVAVLTAVQMAPLPGYWELVARHLEPRRGERTSGSES